MVSLLLILISAVFVNNFVLARFLGICPFLGVSKKVETAIGMGMAVIFVMSVASVVTWFIQYFILIPFGIEYLQTIAFILVIASLVQLVEMIIQKTSPVLYQSLGIFLPLITTNCAVLGVAVLSIQKSYSFLEAVVFALGAGLGFTLAMVLLPDCANGSISVRFPTAFAAPPLRWSPLVCCLLPLWALPDWSKDNVTRSCRLQSEYLYIF